MGQLDLVDGLAEGPPVEQALRRDPVQSPAFGRPEILVQRLPHEVVDELVAAIVRRP